MKLIPFVDMLKMTKEAVDDFLAPVRARHIRAKAELKLAELEEDMVRIDRKTVELCCQKDIDFNAIIDNMNKYDLSERKVKQIRQIIAELFPELGVEPVAEGEKP